MAKERPAMDLDLRARHDSAGAKVGKVTSYDVSELRAIELLEQVRSARARARDRESSFPPTAVPSLSRDGFAPPLA